MSQGLATRAERVASPPYHGGSLDDLVLDAVRPLFAQLPDDVRAAYYVRHWRRGPHVRLNLRADPDRFAAAVLPALDQVIGAYLAQRPSRAAPDPDRLLPVHQRLAEAEREPGPLLPWRPDNSWHLEPYDRRIDVLGGEAAADLLAAYLVDTTELAFQMTEHTRAAGQRARLAFDLMVAVAYALSDADITRGFISFRSHAEAFLFTQPQGEHLRDRWDRQYRRHARQLVDRVRAVVAALDGDGPAVPFVAAWVSALAPYRARGKHLIETGAITMDEAWTRLRAEQPSGNLSRFHQRMLDNESFLRLVAPSVWFAAYRLMLNYTYLQFTRLGMTPVERFWTCHLVANAVEECYGCSAFELIGREVGSLPATQGTS